MALGAVLAAVPAAARAQTDSLPAADTLRGLPLPDTAAAQPPSRPGKGGALLNPAADTLPAAADSSRRRVQEVLLGIGSRLESYAPSTFLDSGRLRLRIRIPWHESDVVIPLPKALLPPGPRPPYDPTVAWQRSLIFPCWGQIYNRSYWKIPIFYAGYAGAAWYLNFNQVQYRRFGQAYRCATGSLNCQPPDDLSDFDTQGLRSRRDFYRKYRDYSIIGLAGWHLVQVAEAYVNAHLKSLDVSDDLSFRTAPAFQTGPFGRPAPGIALGFVF
ncbi:MAG: DUF5683 domain-containing protein [Bacteroidia bacterium]|nr:DUF5683 domain-containing protein [Bacteroidia bacterium]